MKINRITHIVLSVWMVILHLGITTHVHYCGGEVANIDTHLSTNELDFCGSNGCCASEEDSEKHESNGCCEDTIIAWEVEKALQPTWIDFCYTGAIIPEFEWSIAEVEKFFDAPKPTYQNPLVHAPPLYELFSQRIYYA